MRKNEFPEELKDDWVLLAYEGSGGQSNISRLKNKHDDRLAVLKILRLPKPVEKRRIAVERFHREIDILKRCSHKNIAEILADGGNDNPWYVTPHGAPLDQWWPTMISGASASEVFDLASQVIEGLLDGLAVLHALTEPVVHRDIKPMNVVICDDDRPVLIDFGVAYRSSDERLTVLDNRAVANKYVAPGEAYYGAVDDPSPAWDCLGISWLWAWLLAEAHAKYDRFHWRFHRFVEDPRCERVRAIFAACSEPSLSPGTAGSMLKMSRKLGLLGSNIIVPVKAETFADAVSAKQDADARLRLTETEKLQTISAVVAVLTAPCQEIHSELCRMLEAVPDSLPIRGKPRDKTASRIATAINTERAQRVWQIELRRSHTPAYLDHDVLYIPSTEENLIPIGFRFRVRDAEKQPLLYYCYAKDLSICYLGKGNGGKWEVGAATDKFKIVAEVQAWLADASLWQ